jgi:hypothetical protein
MGGGAQSLPLTATARLALLKERNACWETLKWGTKDLSHSIVDKGDEG